MVATGHGKAIKRRRVRASALPGARQRIGLPRGAPSARIWAVDEAGNRGRVLRIELPN